MRKRGWSTLVVGVCTAAVLVAGSPRSAAAHEHRTVGDIQMTVGWANEPTFSGFMNAVQLFLADKNKKPISGAGDTLKVEVIFGTQKTAMLPLDESDDRKGEYLAPLIPDVPGNYTFHFVGAINGQKIDQSFTSSESTFDPVGDSSLIQFPVKQPSISDVSGLVDRLGPRVDASAADAAQARTLGVAGIVLGAVGILIGVGAMMRRR